MFDDRSAYPHPDEFKVVRPTYSDQEILDEEGNPIETDIGLCSYRDSQVIFPTKLL